MKKTKITQSLIQELYQAVEVIDDTPGKNLSTKELISYVRDNSNIPPHANAVKYFLEFLELKGEIHRYTYRSLILTDKFKVHNDPEKFLEEFEIYLDNIGSVTYKLTGNEDRKLGRASDKIFESLLYLTKVIFYLNKVSVNELIRYITNDRHKPTVITPYKTIVRDFVGGINKLGFIDSHKKTLIISENDLILKLDEVVPYLKVLTELDQRASNMLKIKIYNYQKDLIDRCRVISNSWIIDLILDIYRSNRENIDSDWIANWMTKDLGKYHAKKLSTKVMNKFSELKDLVVIDGQLSVPSLVGKDLKSIGTHMYSLMINSNEKIQEQNVDKQILENDQSTVSSSDSKEIRTNPIEDDATQIPAGSDILIETDNDHNLSDGDSVRVNVSYISKSRLVINIEGSLDKNLNLQVNLYPPKVNKIN